MSNYQRKSDLKSATDADTSNLVKKTDLFNLKSAIEKWDIDKLKSYSSLFTSHSWLS